MCAMPVRTTLPPAELQRRLGEWASHTTGRPAEVVEEPSIPASNGMLAPTILFRLRWGDTGETERLVVRGRTDDEFVPGFDTRSLETQHAVLAALRGTDVPVPNVRWLEPDESWIGCSFFVMDHVDGIVAADNPPYVFGGWLVDMPPEQRALVQSGLIESFVQIHRVPVPPLREQLGDAALDMELTARGALERCRQRYEWGRGQRRSELIEGLLAWCEDRLPDDEGEPVLLWGDARIGNLMFRDSKVAAVLDWDGAALGAREFDLAWTIVFHAMFQDTAVFLGLPGVPDILQRQAVIADYEQAAGVALRNLAIYEALAALKLAAGSLRGHHLEVYGRTGLEPIDEILTHRDLMGRMLSGEYWHSAS